MLEMGRQRPVPRHDRPIVGEDPGVEPAEGEHRLDGEAEAGLQLAPGTAGPEVGDLRLLVHGGPDPVADELADDPKTGLRGDRLDGQRDVLDVVSWHRGSDAGEHGPFCSLDKVRDRGRWVADVERPGPVAVPAVEDRTGVDGHDLALADGPVARDAVDDLVVDRDAHARRKWPV